MDVGDTTGGGDPNGQEEGAGLLIQHRLFDGLCKVARQNGCRATVASMGGHLILGIRSRDGDTVVIYDRDPTDRSLDDQAQYLINRFQSGWWTWPSSTKHQGADHE